MTAEHSLDDRILRLLGKESVHTSLIAEKLEVLRTTVGYRLQKLEAAGLVVKKVKGRKTVWSRVFPHEHNKSHFRIYEEDAFLEAYSQLFTLPQKSIIYSIQGYGGAKGEIEVLPPMFIKRAHEVFRKKSFVLKAVSNQRMIDIFQKDMQKKMAQSHEGRTLGVKLFPGRHFMSGGEIFCARNILMILHPKKRVAMVVKDQEIVALMNDILEVFFDILEQRSTFDLNAHIRTEYGIKAKK